MLQLEHTLTSRLEAMRVRVEVPDGDTVLLRDVPANRRFFNKPRTNLLLKRPRAGVPFLVCTDEDLEYLGPDASLLQAFKAGVKRQGWRTLCLVQPAQTDLQDALSSALAVLGSEGQQPTLTPPDSRDRPDPARGLLTSAGTNLTRLARAAPDPPTVGRTDEIEQVASCVLRWGEVRLSVIAGQSGVGKTNLVHTVAWKLARARPDINMVLVELGGLLAGSLFDAGRENLLSGVLTEAAASPNTVLVLEHVELALLMSHGALLLARFLDGGGAVIGTTLPQYLSWFSHPPLARRVNAVELAELSASETAAVLRVVGRHIARHHRVEICESCVGGCVRAARSLVGHFPAKAIALLDAAGARAALSGVAMIGPDEIYSAADQFVSGTDLEAASQQPPP